MFTVVERQNAYYIYNEKLIDDVIGCFDEEYWKAKNAIIGSAEGRGTTWFIQLDDVQAALRHYRRGGLFGKVISDEYLFTSYEQTRSVQEFKLLTHLRKQDVNVPKPIAAKAKRHGLIYRADLLSEKIHPSQKCQK